MKNEELANYKLEEDLFQIDTLYLNYYRPDIDNSPKENGFNFGLRNLDLVYNSVISKGIKDIPFDNYIFEEAAGLTKNGARRGIYRNLSTGEFYVIFNIDAYPELWNQDQTQLLMSLKFGFSKNTGKILLLSNVILKVLFKRIN